MMMKAAKMQWMNNDKVLVKRLIKCSPNFNLKEIVS